MDRVLIFGTNDAATACGIRLYRAGFNIAIISSANPFDVYHYRNLSSMPAIGSKEIMGVKFLTFSDFLYNHTDDKTYSIEQFFEFSSQNRWIPVFIQSDISITLTRLFNYSVFCDAVLINKCRDILPNETTTINCSDDVEFTADFSVFVNGAYMGLVNYFHDFGSAEHSLANYHSVYADKEGIFIAEKSPGEKTFKGEKIASIADSIINSEIDGFVLGAIRSGIITPKNSEIMRLTETSITTDIRVLPPNAFSIAGGVVEAILYSKTL